jgi:hypothetical protein
MEEVLCFSRSEGASVLRTMGWERASEEVVIF